jgi:hypothetical protein
VDSEHLAVVGDGLGFVDDKSWMVVKPIVDGAPQEELDAV